MRNTQLLQKRQQYAQQIRRSSRQQYFKQKRKLLLNANPLPPSTSYPELINQLKTFNNQSQTLTQIYTHLTTSLNPAPLIQKLFMQGIHIYFIHCLDQRRFVREVLRILGLIVSKEDIKYVERLNAKGCLEILVQILNHNNAHNHQIQITLNIISNMCIQEQAYAEVILENHVHQLFIALYKNTYKQQIIQTQTKPELIRKSILYLLGVLTGIKLHEFDYQNYNIQFSEILQFCNKLLSERIYPVQCLQILYQISLKNAQLVKRYSTQTLNELLVSQPGDSLHIQQLLLVTLRLSPHNFDYQSITSFMLVSKYRPYIISLRILSLIACSPSIPLTLTQYWWQKSLSKIQNQGQQFTIMLGLIRKLEVDYQCVWRFLGEYLGEQYNRQGEVMVGLRNILGHLRMKDKVKMALTLHIIDKYNIKNNLNQIYDRQHTVFAEKAMDLLNIIEDIQFQLKDKIEIQFLN